MPAASHEGEDHQEEAGQSCEEGYVAEGLEAEVIDRTADLLANKLFSCTFFFVTAPLVATLFDELFLGHLAVEDNEVHWEFLRSSVGIVEVDGEDKAGCQQSFVRVNDRCNIEHPAWQEVAEDLREPEHQAGSADGKHTPEDGEEIEFLPVGPALEGRFWTEEEEPTDHTDDVADIAQVRAKRIGSEEACQPHVARPLLLGQEEEVKAQDQSRDEVVEGQDCATTVDQACIVSTTKEVHHAHGPLLVGKFERQAGEGEPEEADYNGQVQEDMASLESARTACVAQ